MNANLRAWSQPLVKPAASSVLLSLAERCEREEPSRQLDWDIQAALGATLMPFDVAFGANDGCWVRRVGDKIIPIGSHRDSGATTGDRYLPKFTTSLDAAVTLVPEHWDWVVHLYSAIEGHASQYVLAVVGIPGTHPEIMAATPALALCAAALRARAASSEPEQPEPVRSQS